MNSGGEVYGLSPAVACWRAGSAVAGLASVLRPAASRISTHGLLRHGSVKFTTLGMLCFGWYLLIPARRL